MCIHTYIHTYTCIQVGALLEAGVGIKRIHTCTHTHKHTCMCIHTYTCIQVGALLEAGVGIKELRNGGVLAVELLECECSVDLLRRK